MKTIRLSMVVLFITASSGAYAGQSAEGGTQGGDDESGCDHALVVNTL